MGVKGFAWVGGLALFLGVAFFVKYSFDNNLVPPNCASPSVSSPASACLSVG